MSDSENERAKELIRQRDEAVEIGRLTRTLINDMCRARQVSYSFASTEVIAHGLSMMHLFHKNVHQGMIEEHGPDGIKDFDSLISGVALKEFLSSGRRLAEGESNPAIFGILSEEELTNKNLAHSLFLKGGLSIESVSDNGFLAGKEGEYFKIQVAVHDDAISFFTYHDEPNQSIEDNSLACAKFNAKTNFCKAQIVNMDDFQIHFNYIFPHSGSVFVTDIHKILIDFIGEHVEFSRAIW